MYICAIIVSDSLFTLRILHTIGTHAHYLYCCTMHTVLIMMSILKNRGNSQMNIVNGIDPRRDLRMLCLAVIDQHEVGPRTARL